MIKTKLQFTGIARKDVVAIIEQVVGKKSQYKGGITHKHLVEQWEVQNNLSIQPQVVTGDEIHEADNNYRVEMCLPQRKLQEVKPVLNIIFEKLISAGAIINQSCKTQIVINTENIPADKLRIFFNQIASKEAIMRQAFEILDELKGINRDFLGEMDENRPDSVDDIKKLWVKHCDNGKYVAELTSEGVELNFFNAALEVNVLEAYVIFIQKLLELAMEQKSASYRKTLTDNPKYTFRVWLLRLGFIGEQYKTSRTILLNNLLGNSAFRKEKLQIEDNAVAEKEGVSDESA